MTEKSQTFPDFDYEKVLQNLSIPAVDLNEVVGLYRKNLEALATANVRAVGGAQAFALCQAEIMRDAINQSAKAAQALSTVGTVEERVVKQVEIAEETLEKTLTGARKLAEIVAKSNEDIADTIAERIGESLEEVKKLAARRPARKKAG